MNVCENVCMFQSVCWILGYRGGLSGLHLHLIQMQNITTSEGLLYITTPLQNDTAQVWCIQNIKAIKSNKVFLSLLFKRLVCKIL